MDNKAIDVSAFPNSLMITSQAYQILIVEDEADVRELLAYNLEKEGYQVQMVHDGIKALEAVTYTPHLVLMDIMLPHLDGVETACKIREMSRLDETLLIFLTASSEEYAQVSSFEIGADDYITKPINEPKLIKL